MSALKILTLIRGIAPRYTVLSANLPQRLCLSSFQRATNAAPLFVVETCGLGPKISINLEFKRGYKKVRGKKNSTEQDDLEEEEANEKEDDEEELDGENPMLLDEFANETADDGAQLLTINIGSLRLDSFCKTAFALTRSKVEEAFYKGNIYINGQRAVKKAEDLHFQDEIDIVKGVDPEDHSKNIVRRVVIVKLPDKTNEQGRVKLQVRRWQELKIEAYPA